MASVWLTATAGDAGNGTTIQAKVGQVGSVYDACNEEVEQIEKSPSRPQPAKEEKRLRTRNLTGWLQPHPGRGPFLSR